MTESIGKANEEVIEPEFKKALEADDVEAIARWATIRDGLNKDVVQPFLLLRVYAVYLVKTNADAQWESYNKALDDLQESSARWAKLVRDDPRLAQTAQSLHASIEEYAKAGEKYRGGILAARSADKEIGVAATDLLDAIAALSTQIDHEMDSTSAQAKTMMVAFAAIGIVVGMVLAVVITRGITKPINRVIDGLMAGAEQVAAASGQVSSASQQMAEGASEQASSLEETSASLEEMTSMTTQNADNAKQASGLAGQVSGSADKSRDAMTRMSDAIQKIKGSSDETAKIIKTIDEIAFQTNLLALNAAVEAARAGEAGKGFAVVAEEVRNLAMRSAEAAKNTSELIEQSQSNAENGVSVSGEVEGILKEIVEGVGKVTHLIDEVSAASGEQAQGIEQVNTAVAQMDKVTQSNAANAEESASASEELSAQASELREVVNVLVGIVGGAGSTHEAGRSKPKPRAKTQVGAPKQSWQSSPSQGQSQATATAQTASAPSEGKVDPESVIPMSEDEFKDF
jgi:methyl-accepting chemotaxis protein